VAPPDPGGIEGEVKAPDGSPIRSDALTNQEESYRLNLEFLWDADGDGFPDRYPPSSRPTTSEE
jgi:hypothetical protein